MSAWQISTAVALGSFAISAAFLTAAGTGLRSLVDDILEKVAAPEEARWWLLPSYPVVSVWGFLIGLVLASAAIISGLKVGAGWFAPVLTIVAFWAGCWAGALARSRPGSVVPYLAKLANNARRAAIRLTAAGQVAPAAQAQAIADWITQLVRNVPELTAERFHEYYTVHQVVEILDRRLQGGLDYEFYRWLARPMFVLNLNAEEVRRVEILERARHEIWHDQSPRLCREVLKALRRLPHEPGSVRSASKRFRPGTQ